jgi:hypothetical protein
MSRRDTHHRAVKNALIKDGWSITDDPLRLRYGGVDFFVDLGAEKLLAAEKDGQRIAVEIKSFIGTSDIGEFYTALGQYLSYRMALRRAQPERYLYVAVPEDTWTGFFKLPFAQEMLEQHQMSIVVCDVPNEVIRAWIRS